MNRELFDYKELDVDTLKMLLLVGEERQIINYREWLMMLKVVRCRAIDNVNYEDQGAGSFANKEKSEILKPKQFSCFNPDDRASAVFSRLLTKYLHLDGGPDPPPTDWRAFMTARTVVQVAKVCGLANLPRATNYVSKSLYYEKDEHVREECREVHWWEEMKMVTEVGHHVFLIAKK